MEESSLTVQRRISGRHIVPFVSNVLTPRWPWGWPTREEWNDWRWQLRNRLRELGDFLPLIPESLRKEAWEEATSDFPFSVTPHFAKLIVDRPDVPELVRVVLPTAQECQSFPGQLIDPTGEDEVTPAPGLKHMYPDRVLYTLTYVCPAYCRFCFRRRIVGSSQGLPYPEIRKGLEYIRRNPQIREVILSGGEPLLLSDRKLARLLGDLKEIPSVEVVRIHTRIPVFLPQRITPGLMQALKTFRPVYIMVSVTHPAELSEDVRRVLNELADAGFPLGSQTPLLSGINDTPETMRTLMLALLKERVRPYYIHCSIPATGSVHFRSSVDKGVAIIDSLRGHVAGLAVPTFSVFLPDAGGKVSVGPNYLIERRGSVLLFRNYEGELFEWHESST